MSDRDLLGDPSSSWNSLLSFGEAWSEIVRLSPMVVAMRTDVVFSALSDPLGVPPGETIRMVVEKFDAAVEGVVAATLETGFALERALTGRATPFDVAFDVARAAVAPARQKLRSNVQRLGDFASNGRTVAAE